jgi:hypothetical protein
MVRVMPSVPGLCFEPEEGGMASFEGLRYTRYNKSRRGTLNARTGMLQDIVVMGKGAVY